MNKTKTKKVTEVIFNVVLYAFLLICVISVLLTVLSKKDRDGAADIFGYQFRLVETNSMGASSKDVSRFDIKSVPQGSLIVVQSVPEDAKQAKAWYDALEEGDVLTFRYNNYDGQKTITHRIEEKNTLDDGSYEFVLKGDNVNGGTQIIYSDGRDAFNYVIGKVTFSSYPLGVVMSLLSGPVSLIAVIIVCLVIIIIEMVRIINALSADKKQRILAEGTRKDEEIDMLRRELEKMKQSIQKNSYADETNAQLDPGDTKTEETNTDSASTENDK